MFKTTAFWKYAKNIDGCFCDNLSLIQTLYCTQRLLYAVDVLSPDVHEKSSRGQHTLSVSCTQTIPQSLNLIHFGEFYCWFRTCGLCKRYLSLICFNTSTHTHTYTHCPFRASHGYGGGRWWMAQISWVERQERVKWTVLVLGSMYAHILLYFYHGKWKKIWVSL